MPSLVLRDDVMVIAFRGACTPYTVQEAAPDSPGKIIESRGCLAGVIHSLLDIFNRRQASSAWGYAWEAAVISQPPGVASAKYRD